MIFQSATACPPRLGAQPLLMHKGPTAVRPKKCFRRTVRSCDHWIAQFGCVSSILPSVIKRMGFRHAQTASSMGRLMRQPFAIAVFAKRKPIGRSGRRPIATACRAPELRRCRNQRGADGKLWHSDVRLP